MWTGFLPPDLDHQGDIPVSIHLEDNEIGTTSESCYDEVTAYLQYGPATEEWSSENWHM